MGIINALLHKASTLRKYVLITSIISCAITSSMCNVASFVEEMKHHEENVNSLLTTINAAQLNREYPTTNEQYGFVLSVDSLGSKVLVDSYSWGDNADLWKFDGTSWSINQQIDRSSGFFNAGTLTADGATAVVGVRTGTDVEIDAWMPDSRDSSYSWRNIARLSSYCASLTSLRGFSIVANQDGSLVAVSCPSTDSRFRSGPVTMLSRRTESDGSHSWVTISKIDPPSMSEEGFGRSMALSTNGRILVVGTGLLGTTPSRIKTPVYVYALGPSYSILSYDKLLPMDQEVDDEFGASVTISDDARTIIIGAPNKGCSIAGTPKLGAAYVFSQDGFGSAWTQKSKLMASDQALDRFGCAVSISGNGQRALIGAESEGDSTTKVYGSAYLFRKEGSGWVEQQKIRAPMSGHQEKFGSAVALDYSGTTAFISAPNRPVESTSGFPRTIMSRAGGVFVYQIRNGNGEPCAAHSDCASGYCIDQVCCKTRCGGGAPNDCMACSKATGAKADGVCEVLDGGKECRRVFGICDAPEYCDGTNLLCPSDKKLPKGKECRPKKSVCDVAAEVCNGDSADCPADKAAPMGIVCDTAEETSCSSDAKCDGTLTTCPPKRNKADGSGCLPDPEMDVICIDNPHCQGGSCAHDGFNRSSCSTGTCDARGYCK